MDTNAHKASDPPLKDKHSAAAQAVQTADVKVKARNPEKFVYSISPQVLA
jgi:hypothetical protein